MLNKYEKMGVILTLTVGSAMSNKTFTYELRYAFACCHIVDTYLRFGGGVEVNLK